MDSQQYKQVFTLDGMPMVELVISRISVLRFSSELEIRYEAPQQLYQPGGSSFTYLAMTSLV
jgi:hypothetical protein